MDIGVSEIKEVFCEQRSLLLHFFDHIDFTQLKHVLESIGKCTGTVVFTGVGKSGFICQKISASFNSIGLQSIFLDPLGALHGDVGGVRAEDVVLMFSKSGSTEELIKLVPALRRRGASVIAVTCSESNSLSIISDSYVQLPLERELCTFNLAPVTSTVTQLIFGDTITALLMKHLRLSKESYAMNHPAGSIGRKLVLNVEDVMVTRQALPCVTETTTLGQAIVEMSSGGVGCVLVVYDDDNLRGIFTDGDLRRLISTDRCTLSAPIAHYMTTSVRTVHYGMKLTAAKSFFFEPHPVSVLPVIVSLKSKPLKISGLLHVISTLKCLE